LVGSAHRISCYLDKDFTGQKTQIIPSLAIGEQRPVMILIQPQNENKLGPNVMVEVNLNYQGRSGNSYRETIPIYVTVARDSKHAYQMRESAKDASIPEGPIINYGPAYFGPVDQSHHQTDMIQINREKGLNLNTEEHKKKPNYCSSCRFPLENFPDGKSCPRCGKLI
jgi:hypothetical protein